MSSFKIIYGSCIDQNVDAIVNAANKNLSSGSGVCGEIYKRAGYNILDDACLKIKRPLKDGDAVITPAFNIKNAKYIIHAVGPNFSVTPNAFDKLFNAYYNSLVLLKNNKLHSIAFPLISSGIFAGNLDNPPIESAKQCINAYNRFISEIIDYDIKVFLCCFTNKEYKDILSIKNDIYNI